MGDQDLLDLMLSEEPGLEIGPEQGGLWCPLDPPFAYDGGRIFFMSWRPLGLPGPILPSRRIRLRLLRNELFLSEDEPAVLYGLGLLSRLSEPGVRRLALAQIRLRTAGTGVVMQRILGQDTEAWSITVRNLLQQPLD